MCPFLKIFLKVLVSCSGNRRSFVLLTVAAFSKGLIFLIIMYSSELELIPTLSHEEAMVSSLNVLGVSLCAHYLWVTCLLQKE